MVQKPWTIWKTVGNYDGVILDIMMPQNGWYHRIKNNPQTWKFRSGPAAHSKAEIDDRVEGLDSGADDYLPKPFP